MSANFVLAHGLTEAVLELTLYGAFTVLFSTVVYLFSARGLIKRKSPTFFVFLALVVLFLSITAHWINGIYVVYLVFIRLGGGFAGEVEYLTLSTKESLAHLSLVEVATVTTDSLMIYRLYVVWSYDRRVVIFPGCMILCQMVAGIHIIYDFAHETIFNFYNLSNPWVTTSLVSSLVISAYSTGMIIFKITRMSSSIRSLTGRPSSGKSLRRVLAIIVESAVLQTTMTVGILVSFQIGLLVQALLTAIQPVVFGISVLLIHLRVGLGWTADSNTIGSTPTQLTTLRLSASMAPRREQEDDLERGKVASF
ncbi:hypothetical protein DFH08DRAFT_984564 [Mycena albidolilacea]|uniref:Uncharacterized protein n=1 Tax=Mycena albidolilacea TaxID=1033008 RepID=A0AAD7ACL5_9AGAR|nr:hypothetical protein DFH08DRAFT_984564 [Mycena albidolilacea]